MLLYVFCLPSTWDNYDDYSSPIIALYSLILALYSLIIVLCTRCFARGARRGGGARPEGKTPCTQHYNKGIQG